ncbi:MAG: ATP-binding protein [Planctomycetes bacterium]|nr:ATP-binding protein [Planctomycetota bacterium]
MTRAHRIDLSVSSDPREMTVVRAVAAKAGSLAGFSERDQSMIALAVDEACTNIIKYSYQGATAQPIRLRFVAGETGIEVLVRDWGRKPSPEVLRPKRAGTTRCGGLGIHMLLEIMDTVVYDTSPREGTRLTLIKSLPAGNGSSAAAAPATATAGKRKPVTVIIDRKKGIQETRFV